MQFNITVLGVFGVYLLQVIELIFFPLPSEVSTYAILTENGADDESTDSPVKFKSLAHFVIATTGTVLSLVTFLLPAAIMVYPPIHTFLIPFDMLEISVVFSIGLISMAVGSLLTIIAVVQISRFKSIDSGESIYRKGLYGFCRHPISLGLILIVVGFLLRFPSAGMLVGAIIFMSNVVARIRWEEKVLEARHGKAIRRYYASTGRFCPKGKLNE